MFRAATARLQERLTDPVIGASQPNTQAAPNRAYGNKLYGLFGAKDQYNAVNLRIAGGVKRDSSQHAVEEDQPLHSTPSSIGSSHRIDNQCSDTRESDKGDPKRYQEPKEYHDLE